MLALPLTLNESVIRFTTYPVICNQSKFGARDNKAQFTLAPPLLTFYAAGASILVMIIEIP